MRCLVLAVAAMIATNAHADGDELAEAHRLEASLEYERALAIVDSALAHGGADPARFVELQLLAGRLAAGLDRAAIAEDHFMRALVLSPDTTLPPGTSPKITVPFEAARIRHTPALRVTVTNHDGIVAIAIAADPLAIVAGIQIRTVDPAGHHDERSERAALQIALPTGATPIEVAALDGNGNRVWVGSPPAAPAPAISARPRHSDPNYARWSTWVAVGGVALASGALCAWRFGVAQDQWNQLHAESGHDYSELVAVEDRGRAWGLAADLGFGAAAAAGVVALVIGLRHHDEPTLAIAPHTLAIAGHF